MKTPSKLIQELVAEVMDATAGLSDADYVDVLEDVAAQLQDSADIKKQEMEDALS